MIRKLDSHPGIFEKVGVDHPEKTEVVVHEIWCKKTRKKKSVKRSTQ